MRIFSFLSLIIVLAIVLFQYSNNIKGTGYSESGKLKTGEISEQVDKAVSDYQKNLDDALKQSSAEGQ